MAVLAKPWAGDGGTQQETTFAVRSVVEEDTNLPGGLPWPAHPGPVSGPPARGQGLLCTLCSPAARADAPLPIHRVEEPSPSLAAPPAAYMKINNLVALILLPTPALTYCTHPGVAQPGSGRSCLAPVLVEQSRDGRCQTQRAEKPSGGSWGLIASRAGLVPGGGGGSWEERVGERGWWYGVGAAKGPLRRLDGK